VSDLNKWPFFIFFSLSDILRPAVPASLTNNNCKLTKDPIQEGISPIKVLYPKCNCRRKVISQIDAGISPVNRFLENSKRCKRLNFPISDGSFPRTLSLKFIFNSRSEVSLVISGGMVPSSELASVVRNRDEKARVSFLVFLFFILTSYGYECDIIFMTTYPDTVCEFHPTSNRRYSQKGQVHRCWWRKVCLSRNRYRRRSRN